MNISPVRNSINHNLKKFVRQFIFFEGKGFFHLLGANGLIQLITFASGLVVAWWLTPEQLGHIKIMQTYAGVLVLVAGLGFNASTLKLCSEDRPPQEKISIYKDARKYVLYSAVGVFIISLCLSFLGLLSSNQTLNKLFPYYFIVIIPLAFISVHTAYLQALKKIKLFSKIQFISKVSTIILLLAFTWVFSIKGYITGIIIGQTFTFLLLFYVVRGINSKITIKDLSFPNSLRMHWSYAKFSFVANLLGQTGILLDIFIINYFIPDRELVGYYSFAVMLMVAFRTVTGTVQQITTPYFSEKSKDFLEWKRTFVKYNRLFILLSLSLSILALLVSEPIIHFLFNSKYDDSVVFFKILVATWFVRNLYSLIGVALFGIGKIKINMYLSFIFVVLNLSISIPLVLKLGIIGVAYGALISSTISAFNYYFVYLKTSSNEIKNYRKSS